MKRKQNTKICIPISLFFLNFNSAHWVARADKVSMCSSEEPQMKKKWKKSTKSTKQFVGWRLWTLLEYIIIKKCDTHAHHIITSVRFFSFFLWSSSLFFILLSDLSNIHWHGLEVRTCYFVEVIKDSESYFIPWLLDADATSKSRWMFYICIRNSKFDYFLWKTGPWAMCVCAVVSKSGTRSFAFWLQITFHRAIVYFVTLITHLNETIQRVLVQNGTCVCQWVNAESSLTRT